MPKGGATRAKIGLQQSHFNEIINQLPQWSRIPLEYEIFFELVKKFPTCCEARRFIVVFTTVRCLRHKSNEYSPRCPIPVFKIYFNIILSFTHSKCVLPFRFLHQHPVVISLLPYTRYTLESDVELHVLESLKLALPATYVIVWETKCNNKWNC